MQKLAEVALKGPSLVVQIPADVETSAMEKVASTEENPASSPRYKTWAEYLDTGAVASEEYMDNVEDLPPQEREFF